MKLEANDVNFLLVSPAMFFRDEMSWVACKFFQRFNSLQKCVEKERDEIKELLSIKSLV